MTSSKGAWYAFSLILYVSSNNIVISLLDTADRDAGTCALRHPSRVIRMLRSGRQTAKDDARTFRSQLHCLCENTNGTWRVGYVSTERSRRANFSLQQRHHPKIPLQSFIQVLYMSYLHPANIQWRWTCVHGGPPRRQAYPCYRKALAMPFGQCCSESSRRSHWRTRIWRLKERKKGRVILLTLMILGKMNGRGEIPVLTNWGKLSYLGECKKIQVSVDCMNLIWVALTINSQDSKGNDQLDKRSYESQLLHSLIGRKT